MKIEFEKIRLARIFNIFNPNSLKGYALFLLVFIAFTLLLDRFTLRDSITFFVLFIISNIFLTRRRPKYLEAIDGRFVFQEIVLVKPNRLVKAMRVRVEYHVSEASDFEFSQNPIEKAFNVGHISFSGQTTFYANRFPDLVTPPERFTIYGIKNFDRFKERIERTML